jgi:hypothetical protein
MLLAPGRSAAQGLSDLVSQADSLAVSEADSSSLQAVIDQAAAEAAAAAPSWWNPLLPTLDGRVRSSVQSVVITAGIEAPVAALIPNMTGRARYSRTDTDFRQRDQSTEATNFNFDATTQPFALGEVDISILRNTSYDENRGRDPVPGEQPLITENDIRELHAELVGQRSLGNGMRAIWGARADVEDVERAQFGVDNDRELTERDTMWARGKIDFGQRFNVDLDARRTTFVEERLDFLRSENGIIDTLGVANPVGEERESTWTNTWDVDLRTRPLPRLAVNAGARHSFKETNLTLSRAEITQLANDQLNAEAIIRYAQSGSLKVRMSRNEQYNDRRSRGSDVFRGKETRLSRLAEAEFRQQVTSLIQLHVDLQQTLDQNINEDPDNENDRDRLNTRADAKLVADPWTWFRVEASGSYVYTEEINIDANRVDANQNTDLYEVRGSFILDPEGGWRFIQNYRMQIKVIDRLAGIKDDRFNKQGQFDTRAEYRFGSGVHVDGQYIVDYRRNGDRDEEFPDDEVYIYGGPRRDHRVNFGIRIPVPLVELTARTERGFLRDYSRTIPVEQDRGRINMGFRGNWSLWAGRATISADASHIRQFGPLVREETKAYWDMNASVRVSF